MSATSAPRDSRLQAQRRAHLVEFWSSTTFLSGCSTHAQNGPARGGECDQSLQGTCCSAVAAFLTSHSLMWRHSMHWGCAWAVHGVNNAICVNFDLFTLVFTPQNYTCLFRARPLQIFIFSPKLVGKHKGTPGKLGHFLATVYPPPGSDKSLFTLAFTPQNFTCLF